MNRNGMGGVFGFNAHRHTALTPLALTTFLKGLDLGLSSEIHMKMIPNGQPIPTLASLFVSRSGITFSDNAKRISQHTAGASRHWAVRDCD